MSRPEKSLHFLTNNPNASLRIYFNPKYSLHLLVLLLEIEMEISSAEELRGIKTIKRLNEYMVLYLYSPYLVTDKSIRLFSLFIFSLTM